MFGRRFVACFVVAVAALVPTVASADDSGLSPTRLKLPSGPGSLEGVGENAEANFNMGLVTYAVPFSVPAGYQGFSPSLGLSYTSAGGQGVAGMGWDVGAPTIERTTVRGLPEYDGNDVFATGGGAELVRMPGTRTYRERFEGSFVRYTWLDAGDGSEGYFRAEYPDGRVGYFGATAAGVIVPEARTAGYGGTFAYHLVEMVDVFDHRIVYEYVLDGGRPYLAHVGWVASQGGWRYEVELTYEPRMDVLTDGKPGVLVHLAQRLADVRVLVRGEQLRRYHLAYEPYAETGGLTRLASVSTYGTLDDEPYPIAFSFEYTQGFDPTCSSAMECVPPFVETVGSVGANFATGDVELVDMNGDALPDVIDTRDGVHRIYEQRLDEDGAATFAPVRTSVVTGAGAMALSSPEVQMMDLDGDGFVDMVDGLNDVVVRGAGTGDWQAAELLATHLPAFAEDANLRTLDVDYDRQVDVVHLDVAGAWYRRNDGHGIFASAERLIDGVGRSFATDGLQLADMNGDGMVDAVQPVTGAVFYWPNLGWGRFGETVEMFGIPETLTPAEMLFTDLNGDGLTDVVVVQGVEVRYALNDSGIAFLSMETIASGDVDGDLPERTGEVSIRFADMNGSGSSDVVWITPSGAVTYLELFPMRPNLLRRVTNGIGKVIEMEYGSTVTHMARDGGPDAWTYRLPHPMQVLERLITYDTLSMVRQIQEMHYRDGYYDGEEHQFRGFAEVEVFAYGDESIEDGRTVHRFDVGAEDRYRKGLALGQDVESAGRVLSSVETTYDDCELTGVPETTLLPVRLVCATEQTTTVKEGLGPEAWVTIEENYVYDGYGNRTETHKLGVTSVGGGACVSCDGRPVEVQGEPCDAECRGDEMHERISFVAPGASTGGRWILRAPYRKQAWGVEGSDQITDERTYYDGPDFAGLAWGRLDRGVVRRTEARRDAGGDYFVQTGRFRHDAHGNVVEVMDPNGHRRTFGYDGDGALLLHEQVEFDDVGHAPYALRMEVTYEAVLEKIVTSTAWRRVQDGVVVSDPRSTAYAYDQFGRISAIAAPGDAIDEPTRAFIYDVGEPVSRIIARQRTISSGAFDLEEVTCFDGLGRTYQKRVLVEPGSYQVSGYDIYDARGRARRSYQAYLGASGACDATPPGDVYFTDGRRDAIDRTIHVLHPDGGDVLGSASFERSVYAPLVVELWDAEDTDPSSRHAGTPTRVVNDGLGRVVKHERMLAVDESPVTARLAYDSLGRLGSVTDDEGYVQSQRYDLLGRVVEVEHPDSGTTIYSYDDGGNLFSRTDSRGVETRHSFDEANRIRSTWDAASEQSTIVSFRYDGDCADSAAACPNGEGAVVEVTHPLLEQQWARERVQRDERGREIGRIVERGDRLYSFSREYDNADRLTRRTFPDGTGLDFTLDGRGRVVSIPGLVADVDYDDRGRLARVELGNGGVATREYDARLRLRSLATSMVGGDTAQALGFEWDRVGNLLRVDDGRVILDDEPSESASYDYDSLYRLVATTLDEGRPAEESISYQYNRIDNITRIDSSLGALSAAHVGQLRYGESGAGPHLVTTVGDDTYAYDAAGQMVSRGEMRHEWDHQGRLVRSAWEGGELLTEVAYGADLVRAEQREIGHATEYLATDFEMRDGVATTYVVLEDRSVARIERSAIATDEMPDYGNDGFIDAGDGWIRWATTNGVQGLEGAEAVHVPSGPQTAVDVMLSAAAARLLLGVDAVAVTYEHVDHLGTTTAESDETGAITQRALAYPFGTPRHFEGTGWSRHGYAGMERDRGTGLQLHGARWLDTRAARWTRPDPALEVLAPQMSVRALEDATSQLAYAHNRPTILVDETGGWATDIHITAQNRVLDRGQLNGSGRYAWDSDRNRARMAAAQVFHDRPAAQDAASQPGHALTPCGGNREEAIAQTNRLYDYYMRSAIAAYRSGNVDLAMWQLGRALHIAQDATSPAHEGEQEYCGPESPQQGVEDVMACGNDPMDEESARRCRRGSEGAEHAAKEASDPGSGSLLDVQTSRVYSDFQLGISTSGLGWQYRAVDSQGMPSARGPRRERRE